MKHSNETKTASSAAATVQSLSAVTLATTDMARSVNFYVSLGFSIHYGGSNPMFTTLHSGSSVLNLILRNLILGDKHWGRLIFYVDDVDVFFRHVVSIGLRPESEPTDADWGERYFHLRDPNGHSLSFAAQIEHHRHVVVRSFDEAEALETEIASARMEAGE
jgi:catechol 2,3-dioxygenase-like lactoylglutathione lyase family enzyme